MKPVVDAPSLVGCDFSSTPTRRKPIVLALGTAAGARVVLARLERLESLDAFAAWLAQPGHGSAASTCPSACHASWSSSWAGRRNGVTAWTTMQG